jgi:putative ABC transport system permease protein
MRISLSGLAARNLGRNYFRSISVVLSVAVITCAFFYITVVMKSAELGVARGTGRLGTDLVVVPAAHEKEAREALFAGGPALFYMDRGIVDGIRNIKNVKQASPQLVIEHEGDPGRADRKFRIIGFDPENDFAVSPWIKQRLKKNAAGPEVIIGPGIPYRPGENINLYGRTFVISGVLDTTGASFLDYSVFMPLAALRSLVRETEEKSGSGLQTADNAVSIVLVQTDPNSDPNKVAIAIQRSLAGVKAIVTEEIITSLRKQLLAPLRSIALISSVLWLIAVSLIAVIFSMIMNERQRELGLLRAMGARRLQVFSLIMLEASALSSVGAVCGILAGGLFLYLSRNLITVSLHMRYIWPGASQIVLIVALTVAAAYLTGNGAALYPAARSCLMEPGEAIGKGE